MYRLLMVDDEKQITEGLKCLLDWESYGIQEIRTASTCEEALEIGRFFRPHIALLDVCIDDKYGYDLYRELKEDLPDLQAIIISGHDEFSFAREAMRLGASDYLLKPIDRIELGRDLEKIITQKLHGHLPRILGEDGEEKDDGILKGRPADYSKLVRKMIGIVEKDYAKSINLSVLAERFEMSSGYLGQTFYKETGMKFSQYLMEYRMNIAKELLLTTEDKVSYIAQKVGYTNISYFYRHFQQCHQKSPSDFRGEN